MVWKDVGSKTRKMLHPRGILKKWWVPSTIFGKRKHHGTSPWNFNYDDTGENRIKSCITKTWFPIWSGNDQEFEFHEIKIQLFHEIKIQLFHEIKIQLFHEVKILFVYEIKIHNNIFTILIRRSTLWSWDRNPNKHYYKFWSHDCSCS